MNVDRDSLDRYDDIEQLLTELTSDDFELAIPPADLWDGIAEQAGVAATLEATEPAPVVDLTTRRRPGWTSTTLAAIAAAIVVIAGGAFLLTRGDGADPIAEAQLAFDAEAFDPLGAEAQARAVLVESDGSLRLRIDEASLPSEDGAALEVWLIEPDADGNVADLVSLGTIDPAAPEALPIPAGFDPAVFFVVDISIEPDDGDPTHSGRSILRGPLDSA